MTIPTVEHLMAQGMSLGDAATERMRLIEAASPQEQYWEYMRCLGNTAASEQDVENTFNKCVEDIRGTPDAYDVGIKLCDEKERALEFFARQREWFSRRLEAIEQTHGPMLVFDPEMIEQAICDDIPPLWPDR